MGSIRDVQARCNLWPPGGNVCSQAKVGLKDLRVYKVKGSYKAEGANGDLGVWEVGFQKPTLQGLARGKGDMAVPFLGVPNFMCPCCMRKSLQLRLRLKIYTPKRTTKP